MSGVYTLFCYLITGGGGRTGGLGISTSGFKVSSLLVAAFAGCDSSSLDAIGVIGTSLAACTGLLSVPVSLVCFGKSL